MVKPLPPSPISPDDRVVAEDSTSRVLFGTAVTGELRGGPYPIIKVRLDFNNKVYDFPARDVSPFPGSGATGRAARRQA